MSIRQRLSVGFGITLVLLGAQTAVTMRWRRRMNELRTEESEVIGPRLEAAQALETSVLAQEAALRAYATNHDVTELERYQRARGRALATTRRLVELPGDPDGGMVLMSITPLLENFGGAAAAFIGPARSPAGGDDARSLETRLARARHELESLVAQYRADQERQIQTSRTAAAGARRALTLEVALFSALVASAAFVTALLTMRAVRRPALRLRAAARALAAGDYEPALALLPPPEDAAGQPQRDELAELAGAFGHMAARLRDREERAAAAGRLAADLAAAERRQHELLEAQHHELQAHLDTLRKRDEQLESQNQELQAQRRELRAQAEELAQANRHKDDFLAMLGHELRNPLAAIRSASQVLEQATDTATEPCRGIIARQSAHLARVVDDLLDVSRVARGKITLRTQSIDLVEIAGRALDPWRPVAARRRLPVSLAEPPEALTVLGDPARLEQIVSNLVGNAVKFSKPDGRIEVELERRGADAVLTVRDEGLGIAPTDLERIFDLFVQGQQDPARTRGGLGIGLALVRRLVELHGGQVVARSAGVGRGAEFEVRLPLASPAAASPTTSAPVTAAPGAASARQVLIVEDNPDVGEALALMIDLLGHHATQARNGAIAIARAVAEQFDVVLLDIGLPDMDGYEVARRLRAELPATAVTRLVALTGYTQASDRRRAAEAGFDGFLPKPVELESLRVTLGGRMNGHSLDHAVAVPPPSSSSGST
jgi:signal transduction histidine kinase/ActR/RegA family two-component response regulator/CHASE3 domain sensor protein